MPSNQYHHLREKWTKRHISLTERLWAKHKDALSWLREKSAHVALGSLSGLILFGFPMKQPNIPLPNLLANANSSEQAVTIDKKVFLISDLSKILPESVDPLTPDQEKQASDVFERYFGIKAVADMDGRRLNRSYGLIGAEQHLMRYPGDTMETHFATPEESVKYYSSGMAPGRGAWGYFVQHPGPMTQEDIDREKYYIAVQTFLAPDYHEKFTQYRDFFKFRKMLLVNPQNGKAMVAVIGDVGPAEWTGKHLGGSPEVMKYLERVDGKAKGPVLYFFLDDPDNKIPLGPMEMKE
ncbi:MAG: hypothetical protein HYT10_02680 [Candidatus Levybacteria bacterium]|nr:hypothetical protein [Candidatus Levybacteria bacterium]